MARLLTGVVGGLLTIAAIFGLPNAGFGLFCGLVFMCAVWEFVLIARRGTPSAPLILLLGTVPAAGLALIAWISGRPLGWPADPGHQTFLGAMLLAVGAG
ncbi:MAG: hypothetical protein KDD47_17060, partial [Acidobacteria bacterium]|nr:hypothetical protein [Acidobacteriota bacterium]